MKLRQLEIENYGIFRDQKFEFDARLAVVYGPNEAGKSTLLQLIRELLFGFKVSNHQYVFSDHQGELAATARLEFSDESELHFRRRKGRKNEVVGQLSPSGREVDANGLKALLGQAEQSTFEHVFAFSLRELVAADESLKHANLTEALFGSGLGGIANFQSVQRKFKDDAEKLYNARARKGPEINQTQARIKAVTTELREAMVKPADYDKLHRESEERQQKIVDLRDSLRAWQAEASQLQRLATALPPWQQATAARRELDTLNVPDNMPPDGLAQLTRLKERQAEIEKELGEFEQELHEAQLALNALRLAPAMLERGGEITQLVRKLEQIEGFRRDIPLRQQESKQVMDDVAKQLRKLDPAWTFEHLDQFQTSLVQRETTATLAEELKTIDARLVEFQSSHRFATKQISDHQKALQQQAPKNVEALTALVDQSDSYQGALARCQELVEQQAHLTVERAALLAKLNSPLNQPIDDDANLGVPQSATITEFRDRMLAAEEALRAARQQRSGASDELRETEMRFQQLEASGTVPDRDQLVAQRRQRDDGWKLIRRKFIDDDDVSPQEIRVWCGEESRSLADVYEQQSKQADELADQRQEKAELAAKHDQLKQDLMRCGQRCQAAEGEFHQRSQELKSLQREWLVPWKKCPFKPLSPSAMLDWLRDYDTLRDLQRQHATSFALLETSRVTTESFERQLAEAFTDPLGSPSQLLLKAREQVEHARIAAATRRQREQQWAVAKEDLQRVESDLSLTTKQREDWQTRWHKQLLEFGFPPDWTVEIATKILTGLHNARSEYDSADSLDKRIAQMQTGVKEFDQQVAALCVDVDPQLVDLPADQAANELHQQLENARQASRDQTKLIDECKKRTSRLTARRRQAEQTTAAMAELMAVAEVSTEVDFLALAHDAERHAELQQKCRQAERDIVAVRGDEDEASFVKRLQDTNADDLAASQCLLEQQIEDKRSSYEAALKEASVEDAQLQAIVSSVRAVDLQIELESLRRQLADQVDQWVPLVFAQSVLKQAVKKFEREHQPAVLAGVQRLFTQMTLGRYVAIERKLDDAGTLLVVDQTGQRKEPWQLSTGSREQLYLAIRLAFIQNYCEKQEPLPIVIDDALVNFDVERARETIQVLADFDPRVQIIFLTCHQHLMDVLRTVVTDCEPVILPGGELPAVVSTKVQRSRKRQGDKVTR
jgi:uncharacterized protein YhaN